MMLYYHYYSDTCDYHSTVGVGSESEAGIGVTEHSTAFYSDRLLWNRDSATLYVKISPEKSDQLTLSQPAAQLKTHFQHTVQAADIRSAERFITLVILAAQHPAVVADVWMSRLVSSVSFIWPISGMMWQRIDSGSAPELLHADWASSSALPGTVDVIAGILILGGAYLIFRKYKKSK